MVGWLAPLLVGLPVLLLGCAETRDATSSGLGLQGSARTDRSESKPADEGPHALLGTWIGAFDWGPGEAESGQAAIKVTHRFSNSLASGGTEFGLYRVVEESRDVPQPGCHQVSERRGTFAFDGRTLIITLKEGASRRECPNAAPTTRRLIAAGADGKTTEVEETYVASLTGDTLTLQSVLAGATLAPIAFKREEP
jgi:hypothetical protein